MKSVPLICERVVRDGVMWCNSHNRPHRICNGGPWDKDPPPKYPDAPSEELDGKIPARGTKRTYTPSEGE